jgi:hypothetical protein
VAGLNATRCGRRRRRRPLRRDSASQRARAACNRSVAGSTVSTSMGSTVTFTDPEERVRSLSWGSRQGTPQRCPTSPSPAISPHRRHNTQSDRERCWRTTLLPASATVRKGSTNTATWDWWSTSASPRRRQPAQHPVVRVSGQGRHLRLPHVCDPAVRQPVGRVAGLPDRPLLRSFSGFDRSIVGGGRAVPRQRGLPHAQTGVVGRRVPAQFEMTAGIGSV